MDRPLGVAPKYRGQRRIRRYLTIVVLAALVVIVTEPVRFFGTSQPQVIEMIQVRRGT
jgi:hypothetical protein